MKNRKRRFYYYGERGLCFWSVKACWALWECYRLKWNKKEENVCILMPKAKSKSYWHNIGLILGKHHASAVIQSSRPNNMLFTSQFDRYWPRNSISTIPSLDESACSTTIQNKDIPFSHLLTSGLSTKSISNEQQLNKLVTSHIFVPFPSFSLKPFKNEYNLTTVAILCPSDWNLIDNIIHFVNRKR